MTNTNNTAAAIAAEIIATAETRIELCASAVAWLDAEYIGQADDDEEHADEYRDPLSFDVYLNSRTGEYIADLDLAVGGPTIRARYESQWGELTITAAWGADRVEMSARNCAFVDWIETSADCYC